MGIDKDRVVKDKHAVNLELLTCSICKGLSSTNVLGTHQFDLCCTSTSLLRLAYFDLLSNLDFLLVETYRSKYSFGRSKVGGSKYRNGRRYENGRSTEKVELMRTQLIVHSIQ